MGKAKKPKPFKVSKPLDPEQVRRLRRIYLHSTLAVLLLSGIGAGYYSADRYVQRNVAYKNQPLFIVLKNRPPWMNDFLVEQIAAVARPTAPHSAFDHQLLIDTTNKLRANPWIKTVRQVRRAYASKPGDTLELDCDYRAPVALVKYGAFYWLVDENGVRLSERFTEEDVPNVQFGPDHHTVIRVIEGVKKPVPRQAGTQWAGADLLAGLKMVRYLYGKPFTEEILRVNVSNFGGRDPKEPQIVLGTKYHTQIWWGRPPSDEDVDAFIEVSAARKLEHLRLIREKFGRVDGKFQWVDVRFDKVERAPDPEPASPPSNAKRSASSR